MTLPLMILLSNIYFTSVLAGIHVLLYGLYRFEQSRILNRENRERAEEVARILLATIERGHQDRLLEFEREFRIWVKKEIVPRVAHYHLYVKEVGVYGKRAHIKFDWTHDPFLTMSDQRRRVFEYDEHEEGAYLRDEPINLSSECTRQLIRLPEMVYVHHVYMDDFLRRLDDCITYHAVAVLEEVQHTLHGLVQRTHFREWRDWNEAPLWNGRPRDCKLGETA